VGFRQAPIPGAPQAKGPHALRERPFDPRTALIALPPVLTRIPGPGRLKRFKAFLRREMQAAPRLLGPRAQRPGRTGTAILEAEADDGIRLARAIDLLPPDGRDLPLRTAGLPLLPIHCELGEIVGPVGMRLPPLDRPRGAA
jgi:hypothetical protein